MAKSYPLKFKFQIVQELHQYEQTVGQLAKSRYAYPRHIASYVAFTPIPIPRQTPILSLFSVNIIQDVS